jgi:ATP-binding cassette, subfamily C, bacterial exporter for protease/lipase
MLVVLDEPNANLDEAGEAALMHAITQLKAAGKTVFLITHRPQGIVAADWVMVLRDGELVASGPRDVVIVPLRQHPRPARPGEPGPMPAPQPA